MLAADITPGVKVCFNDGSGTFRRSLNNSVNAGGGVLELGDVDGDGDLDLLTANGYSTTTVSVRLNNGAGTFSGGSDLTVGQRPFDMELGDVDGDGDLDLLMANAGASPPGNIVSVRFNNGAGTFSGGSDVGVGSGPCSVAVGDVDGDGDLDLLTANRGSNTVSVRLNNGSGSFSGGSDVGVGNTPWSIAVGDVDSDGDLDLLTANMGGFFTMPDSTVSVRLNDCSGTFSGTQNDVVRGEVDGDGDLDLLTVNRFDWPNGTVSVRLNNGAGIFGGTTAVRAPFDPQDIVTGDVDGDGDLDFLTAENSLDSVSVRVVLNGGTGPMLATAPALEEAAPDAWPNPAPDGRFTVRADQPGARYTVLDAVGREVAAGALPTAETALDLNQQPPGLYLLRLQWPDGRIATRRLVR